MSSSWPRGRGLVSRTQDWSDVWGTSETLQGKESGWANFTDFSSEESPKDPLRSSSPVAMETSSETADPLGVNVRAQPEDSERWQDDSRQPEVLPNAKMEASSDGEEEDDEGGADRITETVTNGSMKETVSLTVDAKTETAVFKSEDELSISEDSVKYTVTENTETENTVSTSPQPVSNCQKQSLQHLEEKIKSDALKGPLDITTMEEAKTDQRVPSPEAAVNGPA